MDNRIDILNKRAKEIVEQKDDLTEKSSQLSVDLEEVRTLLDEPLLDEDDVNAESFLEESIDSDLDTVTSELQDNDSERIDALDETDKYIASLEENLRVLEEMRSVTDLGTDKASNGSTERRLDELRTIRELLEEDGETSDYYAAESAESSYSVDSARNSFIDNLREKAKESSPDNYDPVLTEIKRSNNKQLANLVKHHKLAKDANFGNLDNRVAQEIVRTVYLTKNEFKDLEMNFIGSVQARNENFKQKLIKSYLDEFKAVNPDRTDEELMPYVLSFVEKDLQSFNINSGIAIAQSITVDKPFNLFEKVMKQYNGIAINEDYGSDYEHFVSVKKHEVSIGHKPIGCDTVKATIDHELGHQIDKLLGINRDKVIIDEYNDFMLMASDRQKDELSGYAAKNINEFIAECWSEYRNNPECRTIAKKVAYRINQIHGAKSIGQRIPEPNIGQNR